MSCTDYPCAVCGAIACTDLLRAVDSGTTLTCDACGGRTIVSLHTPEELVEHARVHALLRRERSTVVAIADACEECGIGHTEDMPAFIRRLHRERDEARALAGRGRRALDHEDWRLCPREDASTCQCPICILIRAIPWEWAR